MKKKIINVFLVVALIVAIILIASNLKLFAVFNPQNQFFEQLNGQPVCGGIWCSGGYHDTGGIAQIDTGKNVFKFESTREDVQKVLACKVLPTGVSNVVATYIDTDGCQHWRYDTVTTRPFYRIVSQGTAQCDNPYFFCQPCYIDDGRKCYTPNYGGFGYAGTEVVSTIPTNDYGGLELRTTDSNGNILRGCYQELKVFKNGVLIDTLYSNRGARQKAYYDDGTTGFSMLPTKSGIFVDSFVADWFNTPFCSSVKNNFIFLMPPNAFDLNIQTAKPAYIQGEDISVNVIVQNNFVPTTAKVTTYYEVPTILGTATKTVEATEDVPLGSSIVNYIIPTTEPTRLLRVKPKVTIYYPANRITNVNIQPQNVHISSLNEISLGSIEANWSDITVTERVVQCQGVSDCPASCEGKTASCVSNKCTYTGTCVYKQCSKVSDCGSNPCAGVTYSCIESKCIPSGQCIMQPQTKNIWESIKSIWYNLLQWIGGLF